MKRLTGSVTRILPSSARARIATEVKALVCDAMRKRAFVVIGCFASRSFQPKAFS
jgi:hypothetical protein